MSETPSKKQRRMARPMSTTVEAKARTGDTQHDTDTAAAANTNTVAATSTRPSRLAQLEALLMQDGGTTIAGMTEATGWQAHSVRGAMAGALKKRGLVITSQKSDGVRRYQGVRPV